MYGAFAPISNATVFFVGLDGPVPGNNGLVRLTPYLPPLSSGFYGWCFEFGIPRAAGTGSCGNMTYALYYRDINVTVDQLRMTLPADVVKEGTPVRDRNGGVWQSLENFCSANLTSVTICVGVPTGERLDPVAISILTNDSAGVVAPYAMLPADPDEWPGFPPPQYLAPSPVSGKPAIISPDVPYDGGKNGFPIYAIFVVSILIILVTLIIVIFAVKAKSVSPHGPDAAAPVPALSASIVPEELPRLSQVTIRIQNVAQVQRATTVLGPTDAVRAVQRQSPTDSEEDSSAASEQPNQPQPPQPPSLQEKPGKDAAV
jgi:hypothetical protein